MSEYGGKSMSEILKEQLALIGLLVLFVGIVSTETYYAWFGLRYQLLDVPATHLLYRGITSLVGEPLLALPYLVAVGCLCLDDQATRRNWSIRSVSVPLTYAVLVGLIAASYYGALHAANAAAQRDATAATSTLPRLLLAQPGVHQCEMDQDISTYRILRLTDDQLLAIRPGEADADVRPALRHFPRGCFGAITTAR